MSAAALVVDNEAPARDELVYLLQTLPLIGPVDAAASPAQALRWLEGRRYDVALLDVRMPGLDGIELARVLRRLAAPPQIIFVTAYEEYAVEAFEVRASDYLLKPVSRSRLAAALDRTLVPPPPGPASDDGLASVRVEISGRIRLVDRARVCWVEAAGDYARLHLADGTSHLLRTPMSVLEERWAAHGFLRIHRGYLVQVDHITEFASTGGSHSVTVLGRELPVARRHAHEVRDRFLHARGR